MGHDCTDCRVPKIKVENGGKIHRAFMHRSEPAGRALNPAVAYHCRLLGAWRDMVGTRYCGTPAIQEVPGTLGPWQGCANLFSPRLQTRDATGWIRQFSADSSFRHLKRSDARSRSCETAAAAIEHVRHHRPNPYRPKAGSPLSGLTRAIQQPVAFGPPRQSPPCGRVSLFAIELLLTRVC
jgi:hypothetical protein